MSKKIGIAICGGMCSGKSFLAKKLKSNKIYSFADNLKKLVSYISDNDDIKNRILLQQIGEGAKSTFGDNFWAQQLIKQIISENKNIVIIDDLRFNVELETLMSDNTRKWLIVRLDISSKMQFERIKKLYKNYKNHINGLSHISENEYKKFNVDLSIDCTLHIDQMVKMVYEEILNNL